MPLASPVSYNLSETAQKSLNISKEKHLEKNTPTFHIQPENGTAGVLPETFAGGLRLLFDRIFALKSHRRLSEPKASYVGGIFDFSKYSIKL